MPRGNSFRRAHFIEVNDPMHLLTVVSIYISSSLLVVHLQCSKYHPLVTRRESALKPTIYQEN